MKLIGRLHIATVLFGLVMELSVLYPLTRFLATDLVGVAVILLYLALGLLAGWIVYAQVEQLPRIRLWVVGIGVVAALLIPLGFRLCHWDTAVMLAVTYWRGVVLSHYSDKPRMVTSTVMELVAIMLGTLLLEFIAHRPVFTAVAAPSYLLFFASGLATLAAARADLLRRRWEGGLKRRELTIQGAMALFGILLIVVPAVLVWAVATPYLPTLAHAMAWLGSTILYLVAVAATYVLYYPAKGLAWLILRGQRQAQPQGDGPNDLAMFEEFLKYLQGLDDGRPTPEWLQRLIGFVFIVVLTTAVGVWAYRHIGRRYRLGADDDIPEERLSLRSMESSAPVVRAAARLPVDQLVGDTLALRVRRLYRQLQQAGQKAGRGRRPGETPLEYARSLVGTTLGVAAAAVTELYSQVRYAEREPEQRPVAEAERLMEGPGRK